MESLLKKVPKGKEGKTNPLSPNEASDLEYERN